MVDKSLQRASKKLMAYLDANAGNNPAYHDAAIYIRILQADVEAQRKAKGEARRAAADAEAAAMGLMAERDQLKAENSRLRQIISDSATACGAAMSAECTVEFMGHLPAEIAGVLGQFCAELERVKAEGLALLVNARPFLASRLTELPSIRERVENPEAVDRAVEKLSALVSHIDAALGKGGGQNGSKAAETRASAGLEGGGHGSKGTGGHSAENQAETRVNPGSELAGKGGRADG